ncbi:MAG: hypothetical protein WBB95_03190 [Pseudomonas sp.]|uniref:hypothetical protein n=1 Tax=Pseudomonas sp. TaxID=306 RepID=UPI003C72B6FE
MNISTASRTLAVTPTQQAGVSWQAVRENPHIVIPAFNASERRFGENFDCSTHAAVIKMMMMTFGRTPADMFDQVERTARGYAITMKDEFKVELTCEELRQVCIASRFTGADDAAVRAANLVLAAFVKRKQLAGGYPGFAAALAKTLEGETALRCLQGMGVYGLAQNVSARQMVGEAVVGVLETHNRGSALVVDGVKHHYGDTSRVDRGYGYRLLNVATARRTREVAAVSAVAVGVRPTDVWSGFYQGSQGNCVTVSAIKAAMMRFGQNPAGIYRHIGAVPAGYEVVMRDGFRLCVSHDELSKATRGSNLRGSDQALLGDANFLFAVSAKRAQLENNDFRGNQSFAVAMDTLNDGEHPGQALRRLGLYGYVRDTDVGELANGAIGTLADHGHSMAVVNGVLDYYGHKHDLAPSRWMNTGYRALKLV